jgi:hypothetical protein
MDSCLKMPFRLRRWQRHLRARLRIFPHPKSLSLGERDFESCSLLPLGEGLGMRADVSS